ncbi:MAG: tRNA (cytidine(34)-2'-O)-methyltransferase [Phycisphaerales bacterium]|nr:tRNA (cytidine(34)-2'-O)-methyltransferase [Phycisphaerales bacterium]
MTGPLFHVVLYQPEIPNNTGNIGRTCMATGCSLHLIHPLGFDTSEKAFRRAGLDYWQGLDVRHHTDWQAFLASDPALPGRLILYTTAAHRPHWDHPFQRGDYLLFGKETAGVPDAVAAAAPQHVTLPMPTGARSLNLATVVCTAIYEGMRQVSV